MRIRKNPIVLWLAVFLCVIQACRDRTVPTSPDSRVSQIILVRSSFDSLHANIGGSYRMGVWRQNKIYCVAPFREIIVDAQLGVVRDTILTLFYAFPFVAINEAGTRALLAHYIYSGSGYGSLYSLDIASGALVRFRDSILSISSVRWLHHSNKCVYYSDGNESIGLTSGYYLYDFETGSDSLLLPHASVGRDLEGPNGFDISPDDAKILFPLHSWIEYPKIVERDLRTGLQETLSVAFDRQFLWLRYDSQGRNLVYANFYGGAGGHSGGDTTEIGIIHRETLIKQVLGVNTQTTPPLRSVNLYPDWSSDGEHIVYGSAPGPFDEPPGAVGYFSLYIISNIRQ